MKGTPEEEDSDVAHDVAMHLKEAFEELEARWMDEVKRVVLLAYYQHVTPWARDNGVEFRSQNFRGAELCWPDGTPCSDYDIPRLELELSRIRDELPKLAHLTEERVERARVGSEARQIEDSFWKARLMFPTAVHLLGLYLCDEEMKKVKQRSVPDPDGFPETEKEQS